MTPDVEKRVALAFDILMMVGLVGSTLTLIATVLSRVRRNAVWYTFILSWIIYCISFLLLLFGGHANEKHVPLELIRVQAVLTEVTPPFAASASLAFIIEAYLSIRNVMFGTENSKNRQIASVVLILMPYVVFIALLIEALALLLPTSLTHRSTMCAAGACFSSTNPIPGIISDAVVIACLIPAITFDILMYVLLKKLKAAQRRSRHTSRRLANNCFIRISLFCVVGAGMTIANVVLLIFAFFSDNDNRNVVSSDNRNAAHIILALFPIGVVAIFGTHEDLLEVWMFWNWRWRRNQNPEESDDMTYRDSRLSLASTGQLSHSTMSVIAPSDLSTPTTSITSRVMQVESRV